MAKLEGSLEQLRAQVRQAQQVAGLGAAAMTLYHETNNLLTPLLNYAEAALRADDPQLMRKALAVTLTNARMLVGMSERLLQIGAAKPAQPEAASIREAVDDAVASLCRDLSKDGIRFSGDVDESLCVRMDPLHLRQVFFNLFLNAREAMKEARGRRLTVEAERSADAVIIRVEDSGKGIAPEILPRLFEPLQSTRVADGAGQHRCGGLGLALCRDLIETAGGRIRVESAPDNGSTFIISLPPA